MTKRSCFNCQHYAPKVPDDWNPSYTGQTFSIWSLRQHLDARNLTPHPLNGWPGQCCYNPTPAAVTSTHRCAHHTVNEAMLYDWNRWLWEADKARENTSLREQLKEAKRLAQERYHKLRGTQPKAKRNGAHPNATP